MEVFPVTTRAIQKPDSWCARQDRRIGITGRGCRGETVTEAADEPEPVRNRSFIPVKQLGQNRIDHGAGHIRQPEIPTAITVRQPGMINPEQV